MSCRKNPPQFAPLMPAAGISPRSLRAPGGLMLCYLRALAASASMRPAQISPIGVSTDHRFSRAIRRPERALFAFVVKG